MCGHRNKLFFRLAVFRSSVVDKQNNGSYNISVDVYRTYRSASLSAEETMLILASPIR